MDRSKELEDQIALVVFDSSSDSRTRTRRTVSSLSFIPPRTVERFSQYALGQVSWRCAGVQGRPYGLDAERGVSETVCHSISRRRRSLARRTQRAI